MISFDSIKDAEQHDRSKLREEYQDFDDWSKILDYDESVGPFNRARRGNGWRSSINLDDPFDRWFGTWKQMSEDPNHAEEWGDVCMLMMLHDRLESHGWDIDDIISKLHETDAFQRQAHRRRFRMRST